ncbi:MAG: hypothetical protein HQL56_06910 [Magnetococcales bacterium]|nr:hypothetical protein [Magnetococcales bacterium]
MTIPLIYTPPSAHTNARAQHLADLASATQAAFDKVPDEEVLNADRVCYASSVGGTADVVTVTLPETVTYTAGLHVCFLAVYANTGPVTINVNALGAKALKRHDGSSLVANDIVAGQIVDLRYDGTNFQVANAAALATEAAASAAAASASASAAATSASSASASASAAATSASSASASATLAGAAVIVGCDDTGTTNACAIAPTPAILTYVRYMRFLFKAANTNTGACTLAVNGLSAKAIQKQGQPLVAGDIASGDVVEVVYDGTQFQMVSPSRTPVRSSWSNFFARETTGLANQTGDGTTITVPFGTEDFDDNADYSPNVFTAPVTGCFHFDVCVECSGLAGKTGLQLNLVTSNFTLALVDYHPGNVNVSGTAYFTASVTCKMDAGDTAYVTYTVAGGAKDADVTVGAGYTTRFSGYRVA